MDIWKQYFYATLNTKDNADEEVIYQGPKEQFEPPAKDEVWEIRTFKNNKLSGENSISAEFIKYGDKKLWEEIHTLIKKYRHKKCQRTGKLHLYAPYVIREIKCSVAFVEGCAS